MDAIHDERSEYDIKGIDPDAVTHQRDLEEYEKIYGQFVVDNYYGGSSLPITPDFFEECWEEMTEVQKKKLSEKAGVKFELDINPNIILGED